MRVLLDTHLLLWAAGLPDLLPERARAVIKDPETELVVVVPKRDVSPVTTRLVEMMKHPARVVGV